MPTSSNSWRRRKRDGKRAREQRRGGEEVCKIEPLQGERLEEKRILKGSKVGRASKRKGEREQRGEEIGDG